MLRDLPFAEPDRLVAIQLRDPRGMTVAASYADFRDWREQTTSFEGLAANANGVMNLSDGTSAPVRLRGSYLSANTFGLLRTAPIQGPLAAVSATLREEVRALDPTLPLFAIETLDAALARAAFRLG